MGNFDDHLRYGYLSHIFVAVVCSLGVWLQSASLTYGIGLISVTVPVTLVGATFPDIDHHASKPHQVVRFLTFIAALTGTSQLLVGPLQSETSMVSQALATALNIPHALIYPTGVTLATLAVGLYAVRVLSQIRPAHRGITHNLSTGLLGATFATSSGWLLLSQLPQVTEPALTSVGLGCAFLIGFLSHLYCDGILTRGIPSL